LTVDVGSSVSVLTV